MNLELSSMAIEMPRLARHPNRAAFHGVLTLVDVPSNRAPSGARGHRVILSRSAAASALSSLLGMGLDYTPQMDGHDTRKKVGIITEANIVALSSESLAAGSLTKDPGRIEVKGFLFARDFPDVVREIRASSLASGEPALGMSYEIAEAKVADLNAAIWTLTEVTFTGAAVLRRDKAAYDATSIELDQPGQTPGRSRPRQPKNTGANMNEEITQQFLTTASRLAAASEALEQTLARLDSGFASRTEALTSKVDRIIAAVEDSDGQSRDSQLRESMERRIAELERSNNELKAQASRSSARKTLPPVITALLAKNGLEQKDRIDPSVLDQTLAALSVEQRIAVKAQMARAGLID